LALGMIASACTSLDSVRISKEMGYVHRFGVPYRRILVATPPALRAVKIEVIDSADPVPGTHVIMARHGMTAFSNGEYVRVTIRELGASLTEVAVFTKSFGAFASSSSTPEYYGDLLLEIGKRVLGT
jgi:hypothetical protein